MNPFSNSNSAYVPLDNSSNPLPRVHFGGEPPAYTPQRLKSADEIVREMEDAELAKRLAAEDNARVSVRQDEEVAKRLVQEERTRLAELAAQKLRQQQQDEEFVRKLAQDEIQRSAQQEEAARSQRLSRQTDIDEEFARAIVREEQKKVQEQNDAALARRFQEDESRILENERRRVEEQRRQLDEERRRIESLRREEERRRLELERKRAEDERRRLQQLADDEEFARRINNQLHIRPYVPSPPTPPVYQPANCINAHTLGIHASRCGCAKHNTWNANHIMKIHRSYCNCPAPHSGYVTNEGMLHEHTFKCKIYCSYKNHVHTYSCCPKNHTHNRFCHCEAKIE